MGLSAQPLKKTLTMLRNWVSGITKSFRLFDEKT